METMRDVLKGKRVLMLADTPLQLLACYCIATDSETSARRIDLAVFHSFNEARDLVEHIKETTCFDSVIYCEKYDDEVKHRAIFIVSEGKHHHERSYNRFKEAFGVFADNEYDILMTSTTSHMWTFDAKEVLGSEVETWFFDDGSGSRNGAMFTPLSCVDNVFGRSNVPMSFKLKVKSIIKKVMRKPLAKNLGLSIKGIALFSPSKKEVDLYKNIHVREILVPVDTKQLTKILSPNLNPKIYNDKKIIFLTLPHNVKPELLEDESSLLHRLHSIVGGFLAVRPHPRRDTADEKLKGLPLTPTEDMWEIMIMNGIITEDSVLIAYGSTAQITPKLFTGVEPSVVFLFNMLPSIGPNKKAIESLYGSLKSDYRQPEKVVAPKNFDELIAHLKEIGVA